MSVPEEKHNITIRSSVRQHFQLRAFVIMLSMTDEWWFISSHTTRRSSIRPTDDHLPRCHCA